MGKKLYVGNLSYQVDSSELEQLFGQHGTVVSAQIINETVCACLSRLIIGTSSAPLRSTTQNSTPHAATRADGFSNSRKPA